MRLWSPTGTLPRQSHSPVTRGRLRRSGPCTWGSCTRYLQRRGRRQGPLRAYRLERRAPRGTSATAAAAAAGHKILETYSPYAQSALDAALAASLARIPDGVAKTAGVAFGERAAQALIDQRADDGRNAPVLFTKPPAPGVWRPTPPAFAPMTVPWLGGVTPLQVRSATQFGPATSAPLSIGGGAVGAARRRHALPDWT